MTGWVSFYDSWQDLLGSVFYETWQDLYVGDNFTIGSNPSFSVRPISVPLFYAIFYLDALFSWQTFFWKLSTFLQIILLKQLIGYKDLES